MEPFNDHWSQNRLKMSPTNSYQRAPTSPSTTTSNFETKLYVAIESNTPILTKVPIMPGTITLGQFKKITSLQDKCFKFYFRSHDSEFGMVKEELVDDDSIIPVEGDRIVAWVISNSSPPISPSLSPKQSQGFNPATDLPSPVVYYNDQDLPQTPKVPPRPPARGGSLGTNSLPRSLTPRSLYTSSNFENLTSAHDLRLQMDSRSVCEPTTPTSLRQISQTLHCGKDNMYVIYAALKLDSASLDIKDREWLKVSVKDAFLGSTLVKWLSRNVYGFCNRREAKRYASQMFNVGLIKSPMSGANFSDKCYYTLS